MVFEVRDKVVLITGAASGIGLAFAKEFLRKEVKGITIADINKDEGEKVTENLQTEFGNERVIFIKTDISDLTQFENAFKKTIEKFKNVDILVNNAGVFDDKEWQREIDINLKGTIGGVILGLENYLRYNKQNAEAVIVNIASIFGIAESELAPIYSATKHGVIGITRCWGSTFHYDRTNVRVVTVCPGVTQTPLFDQAGSTLNKEYDLVEVTSKLKGQSPNFVAHESVKLVETAPNGSIWVIEDDEAAYQFIVPERTTFKQK